MANHASAKKRIKRNAKRAAINTMRESRIKTFLKKVMSALDAGDATAAEAALKAAQPELDRGAAKGIMHKKTASRKISRLTSRLKQLKSA